MYFNLTFLSNNIWFMNNEDWKTYLYAILLCIYYIMVYKQSATLLLYSKYDSH